MQAQRIACYPCRAKLSWTLPWEIAAQTLKFKACTQPIKHIPWGSLMATAPGAIHVESYPCSAAATAVSRAGPGPSFQNLGSVVLEIHL